MKRGDMFFASMDSLLDAVGAYVSHKLPEPDMVDSDTYRLAVPLDFRDAVQFTPGPAEFPTTSSYRCFVFRKEPVVFFDKTVTVWRLVDTRG